MLAISALDAFEKLFRWLPKITLSAICKGDWLSAEFHSVFSIRKKSCG